RRLKRILRVARVGQRPPAHSPHQRPMPLQDRLERRLVAAANEALQQTAIAQRRRFELPQVPDDAAERSAGHDEHSPGNDGYTVICRENGIRVQDFLVRMAQYDYRFRARLELFDFRLGRKEVERLEGLATP